MKVGLTTSVALHAALIGFGLFTLSSPRALELASVESFPVEIVPFSEISTSVVGDREAPADEAPAPTPTSRPEPVEDAENVGDNIADLETPPTPDPSPREVEAAAAPAAEPEPQPTPVEEPEAEAESEPEPTPSIEEASEPQQEPEAVPEPEPQSEIAEAPEPPEPETSSGLPDQAPMPQARPSQTQTAQTSQPEPEPEPTATAATSQDSNFDADEIAALLNQQAPSGGGAQRSEQQAALGGSQTTGAELSQSEIDGLRGQIQRCWNVPAGAMDAENLRVSIQMRLKPNGEIEGTPQIVGGSGSGAERIAAEAGRRAVLRCQPYNLPTDRYDAWADVVVHFDPRDMF